MRRSLIDLAPPQVCPTCRQAYRTGPNGELVCHNETPSEGRVGNCPVDGVLSTDEGRHPWSHLYRHGKDKTA